MHSLRLAFFGLSFLRYRNLWFRFLRGVDFRIRDLRLCLLHVSAATLDGFHLFANNNDVSVDGAKDLTLSADGYLELFELLSEGFDDLIGGGH